MSSPAGGQVSSKATHLSCLGPCFNTSFWSPSLSIWPLRVVQINGLEGGSSPTFANSSTFEIHLGSRPHLHALTNADKMSRFAPHKSSNSNPRATQDTVCQKCLGRGHYTYNCKAAAVPYKTRPSRTQLLENPDKFSSVLGGKQAGGPSVEIPEEFLSK